MRAAKMELVLGKEKEKEFGQSEHSFVKKLSTGAPETTRAHTGNRRGSGKEVIHRLTGGHWTVAEGQKVNSQQLLRSCPLGPRKQRERIRGTRGEVAKR